ncbi:MAG: hypothetical protein WC565_05920 [Parcubacteria group bacterium]
MALAQLYVDPAIAGNSGTGTVGDPYGDLEYCLAQATLDAAGTQINVKAGTAEVLAASLNPGAHFGAPTAAAQLVIRGYTTAANDGGMGEVDCGGASLFAVTTLDYIVLADMEFHTFGDNNGIVLDTYCTVFHCEIHKGASTPTTKTLLTVNATNGHAIGNYVHDAGATGRGISSGAVIIGNYVKSCPGFGIYRPGVIAVGNIVHLSDAGAVGIDYIYGTTVVGNTVYNSAAGTASGIRAGAAGIFGAIVINNICEGFSGVGGEGIFLQAGDDTHIVGYNAFYNNTAAYTDSGDEQVDLTASDVALAASPFTDAANGDFSLTAAGKTALRGLGWPAAYLGAHANTDGHITIGAVQYGEAEAGGGGMLVGNKRANKEG